VKIVVLKCAFYTVIAEKIVFMNVKVDEILNDTKQDFAE